MSKSKPLTANQDAVLAAITAGATTDAEIGETLTAMKLSAIGTVARSLIKRGAIDRTEAGKYEARTSVPTPVESGDEPDYPTGAAVAIVTCVERQGRNAVQELTKGGSHKVATVDGGYVTLDGRYAMVKIGDDKKKPWLLFSVRTRANGDLRGVAQMGAFGSSSQALEKIAEVAK